MTIGHELENAFVTRLEDFGILDADADEVGHVKEAPIVDLLAGDAPVRQAIGLRLQQIVQGIVAAGLPWRSPAGRQRPLDRIGIEPAQLLNRWIIPLENRIDYLTLATGKKIEVPFEQLIIFSTNLEPRDLARHQ